MTTPPAASAPLSALGPLHQRLGATLGSLEGGIVVPMRYGPVVEEYHALRAGCGLADLSWMGRLEIGGEDRLRFLNAYVTCDVKGLAPGEGVYGFFTNPQGRILSDTVVTALADRLWVQVAPGRAEAIASHLRKYILADRVEVRELEAVVPVGLIGPRAETVLAEVELPPAGDWRHLRVTLHGMEAALQRTGRIGSPAYTLWVSSPVAAPLSERLLSTPGVTAVGFEAQEIVRAEAGLPRCGQDFGPESFPQETAADEAVSYTKGCYLGQEVVARIHYRGGVQKILCGLAFAAGAAPAPGTPLLLEGRAVGTATTVVPSVALQHPIGLGILHRRAAAPGTKLDLPDGGWAEVRELPFSISPQPRS